jgi:hypothetical protein
MELSLVEMNGVLNNQNRSKYMDKNKKVENLKNFLSQEK